MEREPALTIGEIFANKTLIRTVIASAVAIVAGLFKITVADGVVDDITTLVMFAAMFYAPFAAKREQAQLAKEQASETREAVYAPATVKEIAAKAAVTHDPTIPAPPGR